MEGTIIKGIGGFYYVKTDNEIIECKARGKFRFNELTPVTGDKVEINIKNGKGVIENIKERTSELIRPAVANVTQAFIVFALKQPDLNFDLLNKFLVNCEYKGLQSVICFNKSDLTDENMQKEIMEKFKDVGCTIIFLQAKKGIGIEKLKEMLKGNVTVLCGPSGVGKSTILNALLGSNHMETGNVSEKLKRGKHTTRHSELVEISEGFIVDTPGFSTIDINYIKKEELKSYFPEFLHYNNLCKFNGCIHYKEPGCAIKKAVDEGKINKERYEFYIKTLNELSDRRNKK